MNLFHGRILLIIFIFSNHLIAQFQCPPCNSWCDTLNFKEAGICPHCNMALKAIKPVDFYEDSILIRLNEELGQGEHLSNTLSHLSDVYGPRLMGTKAYHEALMWAKIN